MVLQNSFVLKILVRIGKTKDSGLNGSRHFLNKFFGGSSDKRNTHNAYVVAFSSRFLGSRQEHKKTINRILD